MKFPWFSPQAKLSFDPFMADVGHLPLSDVGNGKRVVQKNSLPNVDERLIDK